MTVLLKVKTTPIITPSQDDDKTDRNKGSIEDSTTIRTSKTVPMLFAGKGF